ncbi:tRNA 2-thiouridine(34) synthase MnmA [Candidatus Microgenomates bacterium]|nr:tRNA 2-thiouridine(34) synthase MnmA [Candidatus Microgenomates bacterium]
MEQKNNKKVMIGMSGGVDSSVSAYILKKQGYDVTGVTMQIWQDGKEDTDTCCSLTAVEDARRVASILGIPYYVLNFKREFDEKVIKYFISEYLQGRTPNPCIACNRYVKFEELLNKAISMNMDYIATGHYAKVEKVEDRYLLKKSASKTKDQTYVLYNLTQDQLSKVLFPLEGLEKEEVRRIAKELGLSVYNKPDSQEICFVEDNDYSKFIEENSDIDVKPGNIVDTKGNILGKHNGIFNYTIGQRKGLGIPSNKALYVIEIDIEKNEVVVGDDSEGYSSELVAKDINLISIDRLEKEMRVDAKIRYGAKESPATIAPLEDGTIHVHFDVPQRAITPGQAVVFYDKDVVVGGGIIS